MTAIAIMQTRRPAGVGTDEFDRLLQSVLDAWGHVEDLRTAGASPESLAPALFALDTARSDLRRHRRSSAPDEVWEA